MTRNTRSFSALVARPAFDGERRGTHLPREHSPGNTGQGQKLVPHIKVPGRDYAEQEGRLAQRNDFWNPTRSSIIEEKRQDIDEFWGLNRSPHIEENDY